MEDLRIVLLGKTGSGKSSTGNTILGRDVFKVCFSSESTTQQCEKHEGKLQDINISVTDTPGLYNTSITREEDLKAEIAKSLSAPGPHVILLVIKLDRFTKEEMETVKWIQKNFGEDVMRFTMLLFTGADQLNKPIIQFLHKNPELMKVVNECEGRFHAFNNMEKKNPAQVSELLENIKKIVQRNKGKSFSIRMFKKAQIFKLLKWLIIPSSVFGCFTLIYHFRALWCNLFR